MVMTQDIGESCLRNKKANNWIKSNRLELIPSDDSTHAFCISAPPDIAHGVPFGLLPIQMQSKLDKFSCNPLHCQMLPTCARRTPRQRLYPPTFLHPREKHGEQKKLAESAEQEAGGGTSLNVKSKESIIAAPFTLAFVLRACATAVPQGVFSLRVRRRCRLHICPHNHAASLLFG